MLYNFISHKYTNKHIYSDEVADGEWIYVKYVSLILVVDVDVDGVYIAQPLDMLYILAEVPIQYEIIDGGELSILHIQWGYKDDECCIWDLSASFLPTTYPPSSPKPTTIQFNLRKTNNL